MTRSTTEKAERSRAVARDVTKLKNQIEAERIVSTKEKLESNSRALEAQPSHLLRPAESRADSSKADQTKKKSAADREGRVCLYDRLDTESPEKDATDFQEEFPSAGITASKCREKKSAVKLVRLPYVQNTNAQNIGVDLNQKEDEKRRTWIWRPRRRPLKLKFSWKSARQSNSRKSKIERKTKGNIQYTPCSCLPACEEQCPCRLNGTLCLKYCGCGNRCVYRFKGCHCPKSQCKTRQCPCFANNRECDPDICKYCWISCGDGSLGEPPTRGEGLGCSNMNILLKQKQRILLAKSDVVGRGAFTRNALNKDEYIGEYTGELISHEEADKRGKIYDRAKYSYLFDLNNEYVLDAYRKGDKLKFVNHSSNPNCYTKVMLVGSEHRIGIYAKERIEAGKEFFYDYGYDPNLPPSWARKSKALRKMTRARQVS